MHILQKSHASYKKIYTPSTKLTNYNNRTVTPANCNSFNLSLIRGLLLAHPRGQTLGIGLPRSKVRSRDSSTTGSPSSAPHAQRWWCSPTWGWRHLPTCHWCQWPNGWADAQCHIGVANWFRHSNCIQLQPGENLGSADVCSKINCPCPFTLPLLPKYAVCLSIQSYKVTFKHKPHPRQSSKWIQAPMVSKSHLTFNKPGRWQGLSRPYGQPMGVSAWPWKPIRKEIVLGWTFNLFC